MQYDRYVMYSRIFFVLFLISDEKSSIASQKERYIASMAKIMFRTET